MKKFIKLTTAEEPAMQILINMDTVQSCVECEDGTKLRFLDGEMEYVLVNEPTDEILNRL